MNRSIDVDNTDLINSHKWYWENFAGVHYSNRKSLNNGVFAVLFPESNFFKDRFIFEDSFRARANTNTKIRILKKVHGRTPVLLGGHTLISKLYSMIEEVSILGQGESPRLIRTHR